MKIIVAHPHGANTETSIFPMFEFIFGIPTRNITEIIGAAHLWAEGQGEIIT